MSEPIEPQPSPLRRIFIEIREILWSGLFVLAFITLVYRPFYIPSGSMIPTLLIGDVVLVSKFSYGYSRYSIPFWAPPISGRLFSTLPKRGDIAVFALPRDPSQTYIKRIVGLPGDTIQVANGILTINGEPVRREPAPPDDDQGAAGVPQFAETLPGDVVHAIQQATDQPFLASIVDVNNTPVFTVPADHVFAMGDNRLNSLDSRIPPEGSGVGFVPVENLVGRADLRFISVDLSTTWWHVWEWPGAIRYSRLLTRLH